MKKDELIAKAKLRLRKMSADTLDEDVEQLINVALADLKRIGVHSSYLDPENITDPLIIEAAGDDNNTVFSQHLHRFYGTVRYLPCSLI